MPAQTDEITVVDVTMQLEPYAHDLAVSIRKILALELTAEGTAADWSEFKDAIYDLNVLTSRMQGIWARWPNAALNAAREVVRAGAQVLAEDEQGAGLSWTRFADAYDALRRVSYREIVVSPWSNACAAELMEMSQFEADDDHCFEEACELAVHHRHRDPKEVAREHYGRALLPSPLTHVNLRPMQWQPPWITNPAVR